MKHIAFLLVVLVLVLPLVLQASEQASPLTAAGALTQLEEGNERFVSGKRAFPHLDASRMKETAERGQHPYAAVLSCSDSRAPVEHIFDAGVGDIFVLRNAGNTPDVIELATIEYAVLHLGVPLVVVMGHSQCGAITAASEGGESEGSLPRLMELLMPAVSRAREKHPDFHGTALVEEAVEENVTLAIARITELSPHTARRVKEAKVSLVGALYDIASGRIRWLGEAPHPPTE